MQVAFYNLQMYTFYGVRTEYWPYVKNVVFDSNAIDSSVQDGEIGANGTHAAPLVGQEESKKELERVKMDPLVMMGVRVQIQKPK